MHLRIDLIKTKHMKYIRLIAGLFVFSLFFNACKNDEVNNVEEIGYGTSFGMCAGYCLNNVAIVNSGKITFSKSNNGTNPNTKTCTKAITEADINALKALVTIDKFSKLPEVIGCPDCADGGAEWVSLRLNGEIKKVTFEYGKEPEELKDMVAKLREIKESFNDCN